MDLKRVEYFVCVAKLGSVRKVAQTLKLTQPTISHRAKKRRSGSPEFRYLILSPALSIASLYIGTSREIRALNSSGPSETTGRPIF